MITQKDNFEDYYLPIPEFLKIIDPKRANYQIWIDKPYLLIRHVNETTRFLHELVGKQLSEIDPLTKPEAYEALSSIAKEVSKLYETSQSCGIEYFLTNIFNNLEKKA